MFSHWGKWMGAGMGLMVGGPFGALLGGLAGHAWDRNIGGSTAGYNPFSFLLGHDGPLAAASRQARETAFTLAVVSLAAKMARADGDVVAEELAAFERIFVVPAEGMAMVRRLFDVAQRSPEGYEVYARQVGRLFADSPQVLEDLLEALHLIAEADGPLNDQEAAYLARCAELFGLPPRAWERVRAGHRTAGSSGLADPYGVLGVAATDDDATVRAAYRSLLREHHPDAVMAQGLPAEFIEVANRKMAAINAAWDDISRARGLR